MKIIHLYPGKVWGGAEQYVYDLGHAFADMGHDVTFYYRDAEPLRSRLASDKNAYMLDFKGTYDLSWMRKMARILREQQPDVVHAHTKNMVPALVAAKKLAGCDARLLLTKHDAHRGGTAPWFRCAFRSLHKMLFVSDFAYRRWHDANRWMPSHLCATILNSVRPSPGRNGISLREKFGIEQDTPILVYSGRIRRSKGCTTIIDALSRLKQYKWAMVFIGSSKPEGYRDELISMARDKYGISDRVYFTGFSPNPQAWLHEADLGLAPSIVREAFGLSPLEFMMCGKCVISSDSGGQPEFIEDGVSGIIVKPDAPGQLAEAIERMLVERDSRAAIGRRAREHFEADLSYEKFIARISQAME